MQATPVNQTAQSAVTEAFNYFNQTIPPLLTNRLTKNDASSTDKNADKLSLSRQGIASARSFTQQTAFTDNKTRESKSQEFRGQEAASQEAGENSEEPTATKPANSAAVTNKQPAPQLSPQEQQQVQELKRRDSQVKAHEQAHLSAAGDLAQGGASFDYETGPDGKRYAVGGEVNIDTSTVSGDPQASLRKAQQIRRAATAPADPSAQDRSVAAEASRMEAQARIEISDKNRAKQSLSATENTPETEFSSRQSAQAEKSIQDTYQKIQNAAVLEQPRPFIDFYI